MAERIIGDTPWVPAEMKGRSATGGVCPTEGNLAGYVRTNPMRLWSGCDIRYGSQQTPAADTNDEQVVHLPKNIVTAAAD